MGKNILLISPPSGDGAERMTVLYGKILETAGYSIDLLLIKLKSSDSTGLLSFIPSHWHYKMYETKFRYILYYLLKYVRQSKPDIVFSSVGNIPEMLLFLKKMHLVHPTLVIRDCNMPSKHSKWQIRFARWLYKQADCLISQTSEMKEEMLQYYRLKAKDVTVINNPIDKELIMEYLSEPVEQLPPDMIKYIACNRIAPQKDLVTMLKAFSIVTTKIPNALLYIIGKQVDVSYYNSLTKVIQENKLQRNVIFLGYQKNPYKYINQADVFVLSSEYEGLPNVMMEAMFLGKPVAVTHSIPYIKQVVINGINGYSCDVHDIEGLAKAMIEAKNIEGLNKYSVSNNTEQLIIDTFNNAS